MMTPTRIEALLDLVEEIVRIYVLPRSGQMPAWIRDRLTEIERDDNERGTE